MKKLRTSDFQDSEISRLYARKAPDHVYEDEDDDRCEAIINREDCEKDRDCVWEHDPAGGGGQCQHNPWQELEGNPCAMQRGVRCSASNSPPLTAGDYFECPFTHPDSLIPIREVLEMVTRIFEQRERVAAVSADAMPNPEVKALYVGPFVLDKVLVQRKDYWMERLCNEYNINSRHADCRTALHYGRHRMQRILA